MSLVKCLGLRIPQWIDSQGMFAKKVTILMVYLRNIRLQRDWTPWVSSLKPLFRYLILHILNSTLESVRQYKYQTATIFNLAPKCRILLHFLCFCCFYVVILQLALAKILFDTSYIFVQEVKINATILSSWIFFGAVFFLKKASHNIFRNALAGNSNIRLRIFKLNFS